MIRSNIKLFLIALTFLFVILITPSFVSAVSVNYTIMSSTTLNRSISGLVNITIEAGATNISQVEFKIMNGSAVFDSGTNGTDASNTNFSNSSETTMLFRNITGEDGIITPNSNQSFWFKITPLNITTIDIRVNVTGTDVTDTNFTNITIMITHAVNANFSVNASADNHINNSKDNLINVTIEAGASMNLSQVVITIVNGSAIMANGSNGTNAIGVIFSNTSSTVLIWSNTTSAGIINASTNRTFWFKINPSRAGTLGLTINVTGTDITDTNFTQKSFIVDFAFQAYVKNETGGAIPNVNVTIYQVNMTNLSGPPEEIYEKSTITDSNGFFNFTVINGSASNYKIKIIQYGAQGSGCVSSNSSCNATRVSNILPPFPASMYYPQSSIFDMSLNGTTFYLEPAATIRLYANNISAAHEFGYMVIDQKVGFPVESNIKTKVTTVDVVVPAGRTYTTIIMRDPSNFSDSGESAMGPIIMKHIVYFPQS